MTAETARAGPRVEPPSFESAASGRTEAGRFKQGPERIGRGGRDEEGGLLQDEREPLDRRVDVGGQGRPRIEDGDLLEPGARQRLHGDVAAQDVQAGEPVVGAEPAGLEKRRFDGGGEGEGAAEDPDRAFAADAPLVAVQAQRNAGPDEHVGQDLAGPGPDLDPVRQDLDGQGRLGHGLLFTLRPSS